MNLPTHTQPPTFYTPQSPSPIIYTSTHLVPAPPSTTKITSPPPHISASSIPWQGPLGLHHPPPDNGYPRWLFPLLCHHRRNGKGGYATLRPWRKDRCQTARKRTEWMYFPTPRRCCGPADRMLRCGATRRERAMLAALACWVVSCFAWLWEGWRSNKKGLFYMRCSCRSGGFGSVVCNAGGLGRGARELEGLVPAGLGEMCHMTCDFVGSAENFAER